MARRNSVVGEDLVSQELNGFDRRARDFSTSSAGASHKAWSWRRVPRVVRLLLAISLSLGLIGFLTAAVLTRESTRNYQGLRQRETRKLGVYSPERVASCTNLVIVTGHSVLSPGSDDLSDVRWNEDKWLLLDYQKNAGMPDAFVNHIKAGVESALGDKNAILMFSGGQTRRDAGPMSEALSYFRIADSFYWWGEEAARDVRERTLLEEFATDSFENLLFSICRFREVVGNYPAKIVLVSFSFKERRFRDVHRDAIRFPATSFDFLGVDSQMPDFSKSLQKFEYWEKKASFDTFSSDPFGCRKKILRQKRIERNPFKRKHSYHLTCPEISRLFRYCGKNAFPDHLPWDPVSILNNN